MNRFIMLMSRNTEQRLLEKQVRPTSMRILVYDLLSTRDSALSLSEIESALFPADRITLYRTLKTFEEKGLVHSIREQHTTRYSLCNPACNAQAHQDRHLHFHCTRCGKTTCRKNIRLPGDIPGEFRIRELRLFAEGTCEDCLA